MGTSVSLTTLVAMCCQAACTTSSNDRDSSVKVDKSLVGRLQRSYSSSAEASGCVTPVRNKAPAEIRLHHRIGAGTFGTVYQGKLNGELVAAKRVELDPQYVSRELQIMQMFVARPHRNVIAMKHSHVPRPAHQSMGVERAQFRVEDEAVCLPASTSI